MWTCLVLATGRGAAFKAAPGMVPSQDASGETKCVLEILCGLDTLHTSSHLCFIIDHLVRL